MDKTLINLAKAFVGESQARNRYTMYAKIARKEGFEQIAEVFLMSADNEREHASWLFKLINQLQAKAGKAGEKIAVEAEVPTVYETTVDNLKAAIAGENYEHTQMYPEFARVADEEGLPDIARRLRAIAKAEEHHENRYQKILEVIEAGTVFSKAADSWWVCRECGYIHFGKIPPEVCPSCDHARAFYQLRCEKY
ncbi:MAG: rubrerythrin family protein [Candidatus Nealsonbacteria bacterium DGGOD1a]|jgi:Rubrerythrin|nr:MAG: rubrerythrin family protein [Candidatus Nealsonbacteria bacterium DGGOD1a]